MKNTSKQGGFITMIIVIVLMLLAVIGLAYMRVNSLKG
jgi:Tfp pilus assembly protein PilX